MGRKFFFGYFVLICAYLWLNLLAIGIGGAEMKINGDWPMDRHDPHMTGYTSLKGNMIKAPEMLWRHYMGLWANHLVIAASEGSNQNIRIPENSFGADYLAKNPLDWGTGQPPVDIDGKGTLRNLPNQSSEKLAKLLPGVPGMQRVEFDNAFSIGAEENYGRMYAYDEGAENPRLVWQTERVKDMYSPVVAIADTDLDGQDEVILMTQYHFAIYDAITGKIKDRVYWNVGRNYGQLDVVDVNGDGRPDFVIQADAPPHLELILNRPGGAELAWSHKYLANEADVAVPTEFYLHNLPNALRDLDGGGRLELAVNIHDFKSDRRWHLVIFDILTGEVKSDFPDLYLWGVADLNSDGHFELFMSQAPSKTVERNAKLYMSTYMGSELAPKWESEGIGQFCMRPYFFPNNVNSASSRGSVHHSTVITSDMDEDGNEEFFVMIGNELLAIGGDEKYNAKFSIKSPSDRPPKALAGISSKVLVELHAEFGEISLENASGELVAHYQMGNFRTTPTVADLDGDGINEMVLENAGGFIEVLKQVQENKLDITTNQIPLNPPLAKGGDRIGALAKGGKKDNKQPESLWKFKAYAQPVWVTWKTSHAPVPVVDLDGDGKKVIICCDAGDEEFTTIYALRHDGSIYWRSQLTGISPRLTESFKAGYFRKEGWDVIVTIQESTQPEMLCLDGRTGQVRWHIKSWKDDKDQTWPYPNQYTCYDDDGDGFHEIYGSYAYIYYVLDGKTGQPIRKPINVWHEVFDHWQAYFAPIPADFNGDGKNEFLLASYSFAIGGIAIITPDCRIIWDRPLTNSVGARGLQGIGDCDGDGIPDIAFYHLDGRIACYDGKTGEMKWQVKGLTGHGNGSGGHFTSCDIDSDGYDEFLYPLGSREIIALDHHAPGNILWRVSLPAEPDTAVIADIDGDGLAEIIVFTSDGYLNVMK